MSAKSGKYLDRAQQEQLVQACSAVNKSIEALAQQALTTIKGVFDSNDPFDDSVHKQAAAEGGDEIKASCSIICEQSENMTAALDKVCEAWKINLDKNVKSTRNAVEDLRRATQKAKDVKK